MIEMNMTDVLLSESVSRPIAKAMITIKKIGFDKEQALRLVTRIVEYAYSSDDVREQMFKDAEEDIKGRKEKNNG